MPLRPKLPVTDTQWNERFDALLPRDERIKVRPMFGHRAAFVQGNMFAGTFGKDLFVRLEEGTRGELIRQGAAKPFEPMKGKPMKEYVVLSHATGEMQTQKWITAAFNYALSLPPKQARRTSASKSKAH